MQQRISFAEPERLTEIFDSETRPEWQNTNYILDCLALKNDTVIADVGAGTGYFSNLFAKTAERVYALDCEPEMVRYMEQRFSDEQCFSEEQRGNILTGLSQYADPCLPENVDIVFMANVYRFIQQRDEFLSRLYQQVDQTTEVVFVDLDSDRIQVTLEVVIQEVEQAGFTVHFCNRDECPSHYVLKCRKALN